MNLVSTVICIVISTSIFFVWVIRYDNIVREFQEFGLPDWLRDLTGILKLSFSLMLIIGLQDPLLQGLGAIGLSGLMACAQVVHFRNATQIFKRWPSLVLLSLSLILALFAYRELT